MKAFDGHPAVGVVQVVTIMASARSGFGALPPWRPECRSLAAPLTVTSSATEAAAGDRHRRQVGAPHGAVGRDDEVAGKAFAQPLDERAKCALPTSSSPSISIFS